VIASRKYSHIIFDFDGVLCDNSAVAIDAYHSLRAMGFSNLPVLSNVEDFGRMCSGPSSRWLHDVLSPDDATRFWSAHEELLKRDSFDAKLFTGATDLLRAIPYRRAAVVTAGQASRVQAILEREAEDSFDRLAAVLGQETPGTKTDKIRHLCESWGGVSNTTCFVGDTESDVLAAHAVPVDAIVVDYGWQVRHQIARSRPTTFVSTPAELFEFVKKSVVPPPSEIAHAQRESTHGDGSSSMRMAHGLPTNA
jgi:phosphoglycolate phosphatase-like HAD superfamily hydrolase